MYVCEQKPTNICTITTVLLYQLALINDQLNAFFMSIRVYYVRVSFLRVKSCIALIPCIKVVFFVTFT